MFTAVLITISSLLVGVGSAVALGTISQTMESADVNPPRLLQRMLDQSHLLPLAAIPAFLIGVVMMFTDRHRVLWMIVAVALLLLPVAAVIYGFISLIESLYGGDSMGAS